MAIEGLPDLEKHKICSRCRKWFEPEDGSFVARERFGISGSIADSIDAAAGNFKFKFICNRCRNFRKTRERILWAIVGLAALWVAVKEAGWV